ncbi:MAG TPA: NAD-dependent epimerase/dehydratase family protein [Solirubrobacterales bacterium]|nr:NAD-dependent epimerase/dehydratase family protein [Solirubrobacterales bacterium]
MRVFLAGASGVIGRQLTPLLVEAGHTVAGTTRSAGKAELVRGLGAEPVVLDVYDAGALRDAVCDFAPDAVMHQLTDLPDDPARLAAAREANARMRAEGTANLVAAARAAGAGRFLAQSIAWDLAPEFAARLEEHERQTLSFPGTGVVLRYGQLYGPGTYYEDEPPDPPRIEVGEAARRTLHALQAPTGTIVIAE